LLLYFLIRQTNKVGKSILESQKVLKFKKSKIEQFLPLLSHFTKASFFSLSPTSSPALPANRGEGEEAGQRIGWREKQRTKI
jgi:hypothetical protein